MIKIIHKNVKYWGPIDVDASWSSWIPYSVDISVSDRDLSLWFPNDAAFRVLCSVLMM